MSLAKPIQHINTGYSTKSNVPVVVPTAGNQLRLYSIRLDNESGSTIACGFLKTGSNADRQYFTYNGTVLTEVTTALSEGTAESVFAGNGTGFAIQATQQFQSVLFVIATGSTGGTFTIKYWNGTSFSNVLQQIDVPTNFATGQEMVLFSAGADWVPGGNLAGLNQNKYTILFSATGQSGSTTATSAIAGQMIQYAPAVATGTAFEAAFDINYPLQFMGLENLVPYFGTASANNKVIAFYSQES